MKKTNYYIYYRAAWTCPDCGKDNMCDESDSQPIPGEEVVCSACGKEFEFDQEE